MKRFISVSLAVFMILCFFVAPQRPAYGYVDAGTGYMALQGIISILGGAAFYMRRRIATLFGRKKQAEPVVLQSLQNRSQKI